MLDKWIRIKKIDKLLFKEFIPPFLMAFSIAMFVLTMQFLWLYIDDIAGKGVGFFVLVEMIYYMGLSLIPMALPIAMLLASVMVYGNLAEKYELPSLKSAGIPLMRVMRSSMIFAAFISMASFLCANYVIPYANLKSRSRLYDIKKQKPALTLTTGVFNDDFQGYSIRIGHKAADNRHIADVMIDDDNSNNRNQFNFVRADEGEMYVTENGRYFVMHLKDGQQYQEAEPSNVSNDFPFIRTRFKEWTKTFDLGEFDLRRTDENLFKSYHAMLSTAQLSEGIDSIGRGINRLQRGIISDTRTKMQFYYYDPATDSTIVFQQRTAAVSEQRIRATNGDDTLPPVVTRAMEKMREDSLRANSSDSTMLANNPDSTIEEDSSVKVVPRDKDRKFVIKQPYLDSLDQAESILATFDVERRMVYAENARNIIRNSKSRLYEYRQKLRSEQQRRQRYTYQLHSKYAFAVVCFIFLFIGAPMGAIVRKGGFGYPLLVAIFFFMFFIIISKLFEKLARNMALDATLAAWLPCLILFPIGLFLTVKAMNDSKLVSMTSIREFFIKLFQRLRASRA